MDLALLAMKKLKSEGKLQDQEESDEINACSIVVPVDVDGKKKNGSSTLRMKHITIRPRSNRSVAQLRALVVRSVTRCQDVPMYTRQCV